MSKPRNRTDVRNADVLAELAKGKTIRAVAQMFDCSDMVVHKIKYGKRKEHAAPKVKGRACSCCGIRPVGSGKRFLCDACYRGNSCGSYEVFCYLSAIPSF